MAKVCTVPPSWRSAAVSAECTWELLRQGASTATSAELSSAYDAQAVRLLAEAGLTERVTRRIVDLAAHPGAVPEADVVVLHRVVCRYPDFRRLLGAAADHARRAMISAIPASAC